MKRLIQPLISLVIALVIFISTGGFMVYVHHCHHHNQSFTSLFMPADHHTTDLQCHTGSVQSCCDDEKTHSLHRCEGECCQDTELYLKISPDTEPAKKIHHKILLPAEEYIYVVFNIQDDLSDRHLAYIGWREPPPEVKPSGRHMLLFHHQLKLGTF